MEKTNQSIKTKSKKRPPITNITTSFYTNGIGLTFDETEIILEFFQTPPKQDGTVDAIRIITNPGTLKKFTKVFQELIKSYEKEYGEIKDEKNWDEGGKL
jgi:hypothetical protein